MPSLHFQLRQGTNSPLQPSPLQHVDTHDRSEPMEPSENDQSVEREDEDISNAIQRSLSDEIDRRRQISFGEPPNNTSDSGTVDVRDVLLDNMDDLVLRLSNDFTPLSDPYGDTLIYIGPPPRLPGQSTLEYQHVKKHFEKTLLISSGKLKGTQSKKFEKFLGPMSIRTEKRLRKLGALISAEAQGKQELKYYIDLRPPSEDVEAVVLVTDLTCTPGVLTWHRACKKYSISRSLVLGRDEFDVNDPLSRMLERESQLSSTESQGPGTVEESSSKVNKTTSQVDQQPDIPPPEYCPIRHRSGIERILQALHGNDPKLDSAPKLWTYFALAKYFDCAKDERINCWMTKWIYANRNTNFIQCNPEVVHQIGMGIESFDMVRDAFSILVGEKALLNVYGEEDPSILSPLVRSVHGRRLETILDEDERNRVDHAAFSLVRRMRGFFVSIFRDLSWLAESGEYRKIKDLVGRNGEETSLIDETKQLIQDYVRGKMYWVMCQLIGRPFPELEPHIQETEPFRPGTKISFETTYNRLNQPMRLFTRTLWIAMSKTDFMWGRSNISPDGTPGLIGKTHLTEAMLQNYQSDPYNGIKEIHRETLGNAVYKVNNVIVSLREQLLNDKRKREQTQFQSNGIAPHGSSTLLSPPRSTLKDRYNMPTSEHRSRVSSGGVGDVAFDQLSLQSPKRTSDESESSSMVVEKRQKTDSDNGISLPFRKRQHSDTFNNGSSSPGLSTQDSEPFNIFEMDPLPNVPSSETYQDERRPSSSGEESSSPFSMVDVHTTGANPSSQSDGLRRRQNTNLEGNGDERAYRQEDINMTEITTAYAQAQNIRTLRLMKKYGVQKTEQDMRESSGDEPNSLPITDESNHHQQSSSPVHATSAPITTETDLPEVHNQQTFPTRHPVHDNDSAVNETWSIPTDTQFSTTSPHATSSGTILPIINIDRMLREFSNTLYKISDQIIHPPHLFHGIDRVPTDLIDTLTCLEDDEWKYLPLWAGGFDDDTGGVFDEVDVPNLESGGFKGGKRGINSKSKSNHYNNNNFKKDFDTESQSTFSSTSSFDDIKSEAVSTVGKASKQATDGTETIKSFDTDEEIEAENFMNQDEIYQQIQSMKIDRIKNNDDFDKGKKRNIGDGNDDDHDMIKSFDENENMENDVDDGISTVMGEGSHNNDDDAADADIQGDMFHDIDDDDDDDGDDNNNLHDVGEDDDEEEDQDELVNDIDFIRKEDLA